MAERPETNKAIIPLSYALLILARAYGTGKSPRFPLLLFFVASGPSIYAITFTSASDPVVGATLAGIIAAASDYILLKNWQPEIKRIGQTTPTASMSFWDRLKMGAALVLSPRNVGFTTQPTSHLRWVPPHVTRAGFVFSEMKWLCFYIILFDFASVVLRAFPMYVTGGASFSECGWPLRTTIWIHIVGTVSAAMSMTYTIPGLIAVGLGISRPQEWPAYFGRLGDAYTVRNCWGRVWHQMIRKMVTGHGEGLANILGFPKGTFRTYFKLYIAFLVSGILHYIGDYMFMKIQSRSIPFFLAQAFGITFEDAVIAVSKRFGVTKATPVTRLMGFCWVFVWFAVTVPYWLEPSFHAGSFDGATLDVSLVQYLWNGQWKVSKGGHV